MRRADVQLPVTSERPARCQPTACRVAVRSTQRVSGAMRSCCSASAMNSLGAAARARGAARSGPPGRCAAAGCQAEGRLERGPAGSRSTGPGARRPAATAAVPANRQVGVKNAPACSAAYIARSASRAGSVQCPRGGGRGGACAPAGAAGADEGSNACLAGGQLGPVGVAVGEPAQPADVSCARVSPSSPGGHLAQQLVTDLVAERMLHVQAVDVEEEGR